MGGLRVSSGRNRLALELGDHGGDQSVVARVAHVERVGSGGGNLFGGSIYQGDDSVTAGYPLGNQVSAGDASFGEILAVWLMLLTI
jgi:hypothetical protein